MAARSASPAPAAAQRRSRLTPEREREIYGAVLDLVREDGYEALTMDAVASRTKSSKATLYRQWENKPNLVACALRADQRVTLADIDTGTLAGDLHEMRRRVGCDVDRDTELLSGLGHAMQRDTELERTVRAVLIEPELQSLDGLLRRAVVRGEVAEGNPALEFVPHLMLGAMVAQKIIDGREADPAYLERYVDAVVLPALLTG
ncbi:TetR/AcrR family transcriptional regulator [Streptomyces boncukensis]|uniref:TetR/AcrR family transcriptional regulator n=1 Tax=Streptomyces boncukensis TaxID=2711219 RepID=A0A6G4WW06_9ACTN|nr:TetR/AcrR family transcriptional regulator [Streptomyces boncukensis]NGO69469.1 TetR/AcrR family transcriptional regulator [Streptomyces boncukensis]